MKVIGPVIIIAMKPICMDGATKTASYIAKMDILLLSSVAASLTANFPLNRGMNVTVNVPTTVSIRVLERRLHLNQLLSRKLAHQLSSLLCLRLRLHHLTMKDLQILVVTLVATPTETLIKQREIAQRVQVNRRFHQGSHPLPLCLLHQLTMKDLQILVATLVATPTETLIKLREIAQRV